MNKTTQVMKLNCCEKKITVVFQNNTNINPFWVYEHWHAYNKDCSLTEHKKLIVKYQDMTSVLYHLAQMPEFRKDYWKGE